MNLLALTKYGDRAASARQRVLQYESALRFCSITLTAVPLLDNGYIEKTFSGRSASKRDIVNTYLNRFSRLRSERNADGIWLQYELFPYAPAFLESLALPRGVPLIVDFDDAIFHQYDQHKSAVVRSLLGGKLKPLLRRADLAICGNAYLRDYAAQYCRRTEIVPTVVDTTTYEPANSAGSGQPISIGWIGSPSTWAYVKPLVPVLSELAERHNLQIRIVGAGPQVDVPSRFSFLPWSEAEEIKLIQKMDIGIMPLPDEPWARGKCGYKLIQYMACGLPVIASPVGVNSEIVEHGENGFLATTEEQWAKAITALVGSAEMRRRMGLQGRRRVERDYSLDSHGPRLAEMIRGVITSHMSHNSVDMKGA